METSENIGKLKESPVAIEAKAAMLDLLPTPVIQIDKDYTITYINPSGVAALGLSEQHIVGTNCHNILQTPQCQMGGCLCHQVVNANNVVTGETVVDPSRLNMPIRFTGTPIKDTAGNITGAVVSLVDISKERELTEEILGLTAEVMRANLTVRGDMEKFEGNSKQIVQSMNDMLDAVAEPVAMIAEYVDRISRGDIPKKNSEEYKGGFNEIKNNLNRCIDVINDLISEATNMAQTATQGRLTTWANLSKYQGAWAAIVRGFVACNEFGNQLQRVQESLENLKTAIVNGQLDVRGNVQLFKGELAVIVRSFNDVLDAVTKPLNMVAEYIERIAKGYLPNKIIDEYKGDFNNIKNNLNSLIDGFQGVTTVADAIANGDMSVKMNKRSEKDSLATSSQHMLEVIGQFVAEMNNLTGAIIEGRLGVRGNVNTLQGDFAKIVRGVNTMLDAVVGPLNLTTEYVDRIASGNIPAKITDEYKGEFNEIKDNINRCIDAINDLNDEVANIAEAAAKGNLDRYPDLAKYEGTWATIVRELNKTMKAMTIPIRDIGSVLNQMAAGEFKARVTNDYEGDYNVLKMACNGLGEHLQGIQEVLERLKIDMVNGRLNTRGEVRQFKGKMAVIVQEVNAILDAVAGPLDIVTEYMNRLAKGDIPKKITERYKGDFNEIKNNLNTLIETMNNITRFAEQVAAGDPTVMLKERSVQDTLIQALNSMQASIRNVLIEINRQVQTVQRGRLDLRSNAEAFGGVWRELVAGVNNMIDAFMTPFNVMIEYIDRISHGDIPEKITDEYTGEFGEIKKSLNGLVDTTNEVIQIAQKIAEGNLNVDIKERSDRDELMRAMGKIVNSIQKDLEFMDTPEYDQEGLSHSLHQMMASFQVMMGEMEKSMTEVQQQNWLRGGQAELRSILRKEQDVSTLAKDTITFLAKYVKAQVGALYLTHTDHENTMLRLAGSYAYTKRKGNKTEFALGEGLIGQSALEKESILFSEVPDDYMLVSSGFGKTPLRYVLVTPFTYKGELKGVIELGTVHEFTEIHLDFLNWARESIASAFHTAQYRENMGETLEDIRQQVEELQQQQEQLRVRREELEVQARTLHEFDQQLQQQQEQLQVRSKKLEAQTSTLQKSEQHLQRQQQQLQVRREELETQTRTLQESEQHLQRQQEQLQVRHEELESQTRALQESEQHLQRQRKGLQQRDRKSSSQQVKDLENQREVMREKTLALEKAQQLVKEKLRDLDLSGKYKSEFLANMASKLRTSLNRLLILSNLLAENKDRNLNDRQVEFAHTINTSVTKLLVLINEVLYLSKVETGKVELNIEDMSLKGLVNYIKQNFAHAAEEKGLYLRVDLADRLPATIRNDRQQVEQIVKHLLSNAFKFTDQGSVSVRITRPEVGVELLHNKLTLHNTIAIIVSDSGIGISKDKQRLIFEAFQQADGMTSRKYGGAGLGLSISRGLARLLGGEILLHSEEGRGSTFMFYLPEDLQVVQAAPLSDATRRVVLVPAVEGIPASVLPVRGAQTGETTDVSSQPVLHLEEQDASHTCEENLAKTVKSVLIVEDGEIIRTSLAELLNRNDVKITRVETGLDAYRQLQARRFDCMVLDLGLMDISGVELLELIKKDATIPPFLIIMYTGRGLTKEEERLLQHHTKNPMIKKIKSQNRLLNEVTRGLWPVASELLSEQQQKLRAFYGKDAVLNEKTILVVDGDLLNMYELLDMLQEKGLQVLLAKNEQEALEQLDTHPEVNLVLMDLMKPGMKGYEVTQEIRRQPKFTKLPIIALTDKAMEDDRQKCLETGVNDCLAKPIDTDKLFSLLQVWLY